MQRPLTEGAVGPEEQAVQLFPQEITMNIRPSKSTEEKGGRSATAVSSVYSKICKSTG